MKDSSIDSNETEQKKFSFNAQHSSRDTSDTINKTSDETHQDSTNKTSADIDERILEAEPSVTTAQSHEHDALPGKVLAAERERRGLSVADIAVQLFLTEAQIKALEVGDYETFPAPIFVTGYLRNYARLLDVPADPLVELYNAQNALAAPNVIRSSRTTSPASKSSMQPFDPRIVAGGVVVVVLVLLLWWGMSSQDEATVLPDGMTDVDEAPSMAPSIHTRDVASTPVAPLQETESAADATQLSAPALPADAEENSVVAEVDAEPETVTTTDTQALADTLTLTFSDESWVEITDANGRRVMFDLGKPGQTRALSGAAPFNILLGNSPAVKMDYNGEPFDQRSVARGKVARFTLGNNAE